MTVLFKTPSCLPSCYNTLWLSGQLVRQTVPGALWVPWWVHLSAFFLVCCSDFKSIVCRSDIISAFRFCLLWGTCQRQSKNLKCSLVVEKSRRCLECSGGSLHGEKDTDEQEYNGLIVGVKEWLVGMRHMFQRSQTGLFPDHLTSMEATLQGCAPILYLIYSYVLIPDIE